MIHIVSIVGARPQFIKAAAFSNEILKDSNFKETIIHTGQHYDQNMSEVFFEQLKIPRPEYLLSINNSGHGDMTGRMLMEIEPLLLKIKPDVVVVYGDTNSTLAGALAAKKIGIKVAHIEAGLRSFNMSMPEEINRIVTDRISDFLFYPTKSAKNNLIKEGFENFGIKMVESGDIMLDSVNLFKPFIERKNSYPDNFILTTIHREENTNNLNRLKTIISSLNVINEVNPIVLPIHPRTRKIMEDNNIHVDFKLFEPVGYLEMMNMLESCKMVITDSGGLQKEAYFFKKKCLTLRDQTEWVELVEEGYNTLSSINKDEIVNKFISFKDSNIEFTHKFYGDGNTSKIILESLREFL